MYRSCHLSFFHHCILIIVSYLPPMMMENGLQRARSWRDMAFQFFGLFSHPFSWLYLCITVVLSWAAFLPIFQHSYNAMPIKDCSKHWNIYYEGDTIIATTWNPTKSVLIAGIIVVADHRLPVCALGPRTSGSLVIFHSIIARTRCDDAT